MTSQPQEEFRKNAGEGELPHWIPVGHDIEEHDIPPLKALAKAIVHWEKEVKHTKQELADEAMSDASSFIEVGHSATKAAMEHSFVPMGESFFAYISASAAVLLISQIHKEGKNQQAKLKSTLGILDEYLQTKNSDVLHKAGLELERIPPQDLSKFSKDKVRELLVVNEIGDRVAQTAPWTARKIVDNLLHAGNSLRLSTVQTIKNAFWNNPRRIGSIFGSAFKAVSLSTKLAHMKVTGKNEILDSESVFSSYVAAQEDDVDLSDVTIESVETEDNHDFNRSLLEESLHIDEDYQTLLKERRNFQRLVALQGIFIGASLVQGVYNALHGNPGWAVVNLSSASAASGPFKFFADAFVTKDDLLKTERARQGHLIASMAGDQKKEFQALTRRRKEQLHEIGDYTPPEP